MSRSADSPITSNTSPRIALRAEAVKSERWLDLVHFHVVERALPARDELRPSVRVVPPRRFGSELVFAVLFGRAETAPPPAAITPPAKARPIKAKSLPEAEIPPAAPVISLAAADEREILARYDAFTATELAERLVRLGGQFRHRAQFAEAARCYLWGLPQIAVAGVGRRVVVRRTTR